MTENTPPEKKPENYHLIPPDAGLNRNKQKRSISLPVIFFVLFLLFDAGILIFWLLPAKENQAQTPQKTFQAKGFIIPGQEAVVQDHISSKARLAVEEQLDRFLRLEAQNESENIKFWGGDDYAQITSLVTIGDKALANNDFVGARQAYDQATERLRELLAKKTKMFSTAMDRGYAAIEERDSAMATQKFQLALTMEPDNENARHGLRRAENLDQVMLLYHQAQEFEKEDDLDSARSLLLRATRLDPEFTPVAETLARVETKLKDKKFQQVMSDFFTALRKNDFNQARRLLQKAAVENPGNSVLMDAEKQLATAITTARLSVLEKEFRRLTAAEQWRKALQICKQATRINPDIGFAAQNSEFVRQRAELDQKINSILAQPQRLRDDGPLAEAGHVLNMAGSIKDPGPKLSAQIAALNQLIAGASTKIEVNLHSDGVTDVVIYHVGRLGTFEEKQLKLRPGIYTVVGSRSGFRDVRQKFKVDANNQHISIFIHCEEPI
jgi:tetratricopeptide (TPR) repeat protein